LLAAFWAWTAAPDCHPLRLLDPFPPVQSFVFDASTAIRDDLCQRLLWEGDRGVYCHTQKAPVFLLLLGIGMLMLVLAWQTPTPPGWLLIGIGVLFLFLGLSFAQLTVEDEGDDLSVHFGPLPVFRKRIAYSDIKAVERSRSSALDGWGIHYIPGRGWTYNLWGFDCVKLQVDGRVIRIGSNDADGLAAFLQEKIHA
jgi:hypothetical protein